MIMNNASRDELLTLLIDEFWSDNHDLGASDRAFVLRTIQRFYAVANGTNVGPSDEPDDRDDDDLTPIQSVARTAVYYYGSAILIG